MKIYKNAGWLVFAGMLMFTACNGINNTEDKEKTIQIKGLYSFGPEIKSFTNCEEGTEYWVADSAKKLELAYTQFNFEKPYEPVYIEAEGYRIKSDTTAISADFDSTLVITKLIKISKEIPEGPCTH
ncbi:hypothetical protein C7T94_04445 [Pedobacter yulinensis]|uniref:NlpE C-terminal OB domain-containing protein n=1 Tax=Pedobacter yulinensis TaxID=2126353 RepID=A0A2T3HNG5_9SPHI|nr:hypothetical protein [Pedobacter yulinensis]PST83992.1 hypothetical protein C7T94_04445 [Pedobacter yulinensis]